MKARRLLLGAVFALLTVWQSSGFANSGDVTIKINGGNAAYIGEVNRLEIWVTNDVPLGGMVLPFRTDWQVTYHWTKPYGNVPMSGHRVQEFGDAFTAIGNGFDFGDKNDNVSPDSMVMVGAGFRAPLPAHLTSTKLFDLEFYIDPWQPEVANGLCVDNIQFFPSQPWAFTDSSGLGPDFAPTFQGNANSDVYTPDAPAVCFDVVQRQFVKGDADFSGSLDISDAVYLVSFIFSAGAKPMPFAAGDVNCDQSIDISDVVYLITYIFGNGPAPC